MNQKCRIISFYNIVFTFIFLIIFYYINLKEIQAQTTERDTNKITLKIEIEKISDTILNRCKIQSLDSAKESWVNRDSSVYMLKNIENINFEDISANIEIIKDSSGYKEFKVRISGKGQDSSTNEIKKRFK